MLTVLIAIVYLAFISMGLPDALLGSAWPTIYGQMGVPVSYAGLVTILIALGTVISSLMSDRLIRRFGTGLVTAVCTLLTAIALFGFSASNAFWQLCLWALPYGLGAGSIDAALNNYVAVKYKSRHMSWIHFCWGIGATAGPYIMGAVLTRGAEWTYGYRVVGLIQSAMTLCLILSLPLWRKNDLPQAIKDETSRPVTVREVARLPGAKAALAAFFCYCALESTAGLWAASYMVLHRGIDSRVAAMWASIFYLGITAGRFLCGFIADKAGDRNMIRVGQAAIGIGIAALLPPIHPWVSFVGLILIGLGCAPVFPCLLHETPGNFGQERSQAMMGMQMASAYTGTTLMPALFGLIAQHINILWYPVYLAALFIVMTISVEKLNAAQKGKNG